MKVPELIKAQGYPSEVHKVVTEDGYILELHRIPGPRNLDEIVLPPRKESKMEEDAPVQKRSATSKTIDRSTPKSKRKVRISLRKSNINTSTLNSMNSLFNFTRIVDSPDKEVYLKMETDRQVDQTRISRQVTPSLDDIPTPIEGPNLFRLITYLFLPIVNKPPVSLTNSKQPSRFVKLTDPSPPRPKARFFKNTSASIDFSSRRDFEVSSFFGASIGDSGASGRPVVLLQHGLLSSSANFVLNDAHEALAYVLADAGYDVWMSNIRGNAYSRKHVRLDPGHTDFWDFSLDEIIRYDVPAVFDYILRKTNQSDLNLVSHSLGCAMNWAATNYYPSMSSSIRLMVAMAPVGFLDNSVGLNNKMAQFISKYYPLFESIGIREMLAPNGARTTLASTFCGPQNPLMSLCYLLLPLYMGEIGGTHDPYYTDVLLSHFPGGTSSIRVLAQFGQFINAGGMQMFDFGAEVNMRRYGGARPPKYSFKTVTCPVAVMWSLGDTVTSPRDVQLSVQQLPNVVLNLQVADPAFSHTDFGFSEKALDLVYKLILKLLRQF